MVQDFSFNNNFQVGLENFSGYLKRKNKSDRTRIKLFCSTISSVFVTAKYPDLPRDVISELLPNQPLTLSVFDGCGFYDLRITALHANHCPGSFMFLLEKLYSDESVNKRILYTGDFRFDNLDIPLTSLKPLHKGTTPLKIDEMYLDTTFCASEFRSFPSRKEAEKKIWSVCEKWINRNVMFRDKENKHVVLFQLPAKYGYEKILQHIYERSGCQWRVHVPSAKFSEYLCNSSLADCTDPDPKLARWVHACTTTFLTKHRRLNCMPKDAKICYIKLSAMFFTQNRMAELEAGGKDKIAALSKEGNSYRICYSTHSSMEEIESFVRHFRPLQITPCAIPPNSSKEEVALTLTEFLRPSQSSQSISSSSTQRSIQLSPHLTLTKTVQHSEADRYDPDSWVSPSPPSKVKRSLHPEMFAGDVSSAKCLKLELSQASSQISFVDTLSVENTVFDEDLSSDEDEHISKQIVVSPLKNSAKGNLSVISSLPVDERDSSIEVIDCIDSDDEPEQDTPDIEDIIAEAKRDDLPEYVIKTMEQFKRKQENIVNLD